MSTDTPPLNAENLELRYPANRYIPEHAALAGGHPYTGRAFGTLEIADWSGPFKDGVPHGCFSVTLGDRVSSKVWFENGVAVGKPGLDGNRADSGAA